MGDYAHRTLMALLGSELLPAKIRMKMMRGLGFDISSEACIWAGALLRSKKVKIDAGVFINVGFYHDGYDRLDIGENVRIGPFVRIITATHDIGPAEQRGLIEVVGKPVMIERGSWIGSGVTILPGVTIGHGCVIAASSVVIDSTMPNGLYAGTPARLVRELEP
jgi:acetyltransferase-like isoleucine patch superfamily enzyme